MGHAQMLEPLESKSYHAVLVGNDDLGNPAGDNGVGHRQEFRALEIQAAADIREDLGLPCPDRCRALSSLALSASGLIVGWR